MKSRLRLLAAILIVASVIGEVLAIVGSWIVTTMDADSTLQSLLTAEGIRWYIGSYASVLATPALVWVILCGCAYGIVRESGVTGVAVRICRRQPSEYIERIALQAACVAGLLVITGVFLLVYGPDAILLSATGTLAGSSLSAGAIPIAAFLVAAIGITYGYFSSRFRGVTVLFDACVKGVAATVPLIVLYVFILHLYMTVSHVLP